MDDGTLFIVSMTASQMMLRVVHLPPLSIADLFAREMILSLPFSLALSLSVDVTFFLIVTIH